MTEPTKSPMKSPEGECGASCAAEWPNCVDFHDGQGKNSCKVCGRELNTEGSRLVRQGKCVVGCTLTAEMEAICGVTTDAPTGSPTEATESPTKGCTKSKRSPFFFKANKKGKETLKNCKWLEKR